ncbi:arf-GAP with dual PH domain-containing protein 2 isoform X2 [Kogia breviceps]|uniref:arf-GAP with dual PH domain-containing protein 2 isoform X2 n=1 Tax=Kogia breviceps TaxID=27615 RepID=UPI0034D19A9E
MEQLNSSTRPLSLLWPLPLRTTGSGRTGSAAMAHGPSHSTACGILQDRDTNPYPLHRQVTWKLPTRIYQNSIPGGSTVLETEELMMRCPRLREVKELAQGHTADPDWASYKLGIFICLNCSGVHRNFPDISKVKSVRLDFWDDSTVEFMTRNGNLRVKAKYEARVPAFYYIPQANDCMVLKEQWIRAKYERQEFMAEGKTISPPGNREGFLWKRGRDNAQFLKRRFVLLAREGLLKYYTKEEGKEPKAVISIKDLNATFQTEKIGNPHGLQITYRREGHVRNLFVYHESGKEIVDWFNALRAARLQYLKMAFPELPEPELVPLLTRNYLKQGFMEKTGPKREPFKKRWFALDPQERRLLYYKNPLDAFEQGQVFLGSDEQGYQVYEDLPKGIRGNRWKAGITIVTPQRRFIFTCPSDKEQREWMESFRDVLSRPLTPLSLLTASTESGYSSR